MKELVAEFEHGYSGYNYRKCRCEICTQAWTDYRREWRRKNRDSEYEKERRYRLQRVYGISLDEYTALLEQQNGMCAICETPESDRALAVDHSHETGEVRGLLCKSCNRALGMFRDDPSLLKKALLYLGETT